MNGVHPPPTLLPPLPIEPRGYTSPGRSLLLVASRSSDGSVRRAPSRVARGANGPHLSFIDFTALHIPRGSILIHAQSSAGVFSFSSLRQAVLENRTILETRVTGGINYNLQSSIYQVLLDLVLSVCNESVNFSLENSESLLEFPTISRWLHCFFAD